MTALAEHAPQYGILNLPLPVENGCKHSFDGWKRTPWTHVYKEECIHCKQIFLFEKEFGTQGDDE